LAGDPSPSSGFFLFFASSSSAELLGGSVVADAGPRVVLGVELDSL